MTKVTIKQAAQTNREQDSYYFRIMKTERNQVLLLPTETKKGKKVSSFNRQANLMTWVNHNDIEVVF